jgi:hypothetical protein
MIWGGAILVAYGAVVALAYAVGPATASGCGAGGHGQITAANGDQSSFRALAASPPPRGAEFYRDNGPAQAFRLRSLSLDTMTCDAAGSVVTVTGKASVNGVGSLQYRIEVQLAASEQGRDTYRIRLSNGYDSGAEPIRHADFNLHSGASAHQHQDADAAESPTGSPDGG